jgi:ribosomal peptide maturation radical SAM protein 1
MRRSREERVLLVSMPFGALERPSLALGLLAAHCRRADIACDTRYLNMLFADRIGVEDYLWITGEVPYTAFAGDWVFAEALHGPRPEADESYVDRVLVEQWHQTETDLARLRRARAHVESFLDDCLEVVPWDQATLVGFTSVFQQNIASLALAARVKERCPDVTIAFGGANWEEAMGVALLEQFPFVDLAFSGEADRSFPAVLEARAAGLPLDEIAGVTPAGRRRRAPAKATSVARLDDVPYPDYDAYFEQRSATGAGGVTPTLLVETARGCWWGERSHCTFCGLNGATMAFRSKSAERVVDEFAYLRDRYGVRAFSVVDDILDMGYFKSVIPMLAEADLGLELFWEIKANLTARHVRDLRDAGVIWVQPGIESLDDHVLDLMRKGTTAFKNIELLKWCKEYGVKPLWNFLYGFPGETAEDYRSQIDVLHAIWHLDPPTGWGPVRLDRFSPYHADPAGMGMENVRPMTPFTFLYPYDVETVMEIAYYFEFDYADGRAADAFAREAVDLVRVWMEQQSTGMLSMRAERDGSVFIEDTRDTIEPSPRTALIRGWKAAVFVECDRAQTFRALAELPAVAGEGVPDGELEAFLGRCVENRLMVTNGRAWLNVAVHVPAREEAPAREPRALLHSVA